MDETADLLKQYKDLLSFYGELESISEEICRALESGESLQGIAGNLSEKKNLVEQIESRSHQIAALKRSIADSNLISDNDRAKVRNAEGNLTEVVNRIVEHGNKTYDLMMKQGVKVSRK